MTHSIFINNVCEDAHNAKAKILLHKVSEKFNDFQNVIESIIRKIENNRKITRKEKNLLKIYDIFNDFLCVSNIEYGVSKTYEINMRLRKYIKVKKSFSKRLVIISMVLHRFYYSYDFIDDISNIEHDITKIV